MATPVLNSPALWLSTFPEPALDGHKYHRGHTVILGADTYTGATRMAAEACSRTGSGLVTVLSTPDMAHLYQTVLPADIMVRTDALSRINRVTTVLAGPGGCSETQAQILEASAPDLSVILDTDAIRLAANLPNTQKIATPHEAEFSRYFGEIGTDRAGAAVRVAQETGSIILLKGAETLIAAPDGRLVANTVASPYLAKAGSGDVLAGMIAGLVAQGMPAFEATCCGVWMHGHAGKQIGPGLVPQDIIAFIPDVLKALLDANET